MSMNGLRIPEDTIHGDALTNRAFARMLNTFQDRKHNPSGKLRVGLKAIQKTLTAMLDGTSKRHYFLSSLDPGVGKSSAIIDWITEYMNMYKDGQCPDGVVICLERKSEIERYVKDSKLDHASFGVLVGNDEPELNALGVGDGNQQKAVVLFTTQEQIRRRTKGCSIDDVEVFSYNGKPRRVKVWDESLMIGKGIVLNPLAIGATFLPLSRVSKEHVSAAEELMTVLKACVGESIILPVLPELPRDFLVNLRDSRERDLIDMIWKLSGLTVKIKKEGEYNIVIDCLKTLPCNFPPCLVLDASRRLKKTYDIQHSRFGNVVDLPTGEKSYRNLTVNVWDRSAGKGIYKELSEIMPDIVDVIKERNGEEFMFLMHKDYVEDVKYELRKRLLEVDQDLFKYCTWKQHTATNDFKDIHNVIMLAPLECPDSVYEAETKAAGLMTADSGIVPPQDLVNEVKLGEMCSDILQGFTRSAIRQSEGDTCPPCRVWMIAHPSRGLRRELPKIFPDCVVMDWKTKGFKLTRKQQEIFDLIKATKETLAAGTQSFPATPVRNALRMISAQFKRALEHPSLKKALDSIGLALDTETRGMAFKVI
jgi:hypothetical protein